MKNSSKQKLKGHEQRIAELERSLGQKQLSIEFLEKMKDLAGTKPAFGTSKDLSGLLNPLHFPMSHDIETKTAFC